MICKICNKEIKPKGVPRHLTCVHIISPEEYYLKYIGDITYCKTCGGKTKFINIEIGYRDYCSNACVSRSEKVKQKTKETFLREYGVENVSQSEIIKDIVKNNNIQKYGVECKFHSKEFKDKSRESCLQRYGVENVFQLKEIQEKARRSLRKQFYENLTSTNRLQDKVIPLFNLEDYNGVSNQYPWKCNQCGNEFEDHLDDGHVPRCPTCYPSVSSGTSSYEVEISDFLSSYNINHILNSRSVIPPLEIDIYIPDHNIAIEFDGLYWHSEQNGTSNDYHLNKTELCNSQNIDLPHIFEDEWIYKKDIVKSMILNKIQKTQIEYDECHINQLNDPFVKDFLDNNHIDGYITGEHYGLYSNENLLMLITLNYEHNHILRFWYKDNSCSNLFKYYIDYFKQKNILNNISLSDDIRYSNHNFYIECGFQLIDKIKPKFYYLSNSIRFFSNEEYVHDRIWDCGNYVFDIAF